MITCESCGLEAGSNAYGCSTCARLDIERSHLSDDSSGCLVIMRVRMGQLRIAIQGGDWDCVEWEFDRVLRALAKLERTLSS